MKRGVIVRTYSVIRAATADDVPAIADIVIAAWRHAYRGVLPDEALARMAQPDDREQRIARIGRRLDWPNFVYERDGQVVGMMRLAEPPRRGDLEIDGLYVHPTTARSGVGEALFRHALARTRGELYLSALRDNRIGRAFYEKHGGRLVDAPPWQFEGVAYASVGYVWTVSA